MQPWCAGAGPLRLGLHAAYPLPGSGPSAAPRVSGLSCLTDMACVPMPPKHAPAQSQLQPALLSTQGRASTQPGPRSKPRGKVPFSSLLLPPEQGRVLRSCRECRTRAVVDSDLGQACPAESCPGAQILGPGWPLPVSLCPSISRRASQVAPVVKNLPASAGSVSDAGSTPGLGRSPGEGNGKPLPYSCLGESYGQRSLAGYKPVGCQESDMTEDTCTHFQKVLPADGKDLEGKMGVRELL